MIVCASWRFSVFTDTCFSESDIAARVVFYIVLSHNKKLFLKNPFCATSFSVVLKAVAFPTYLLVARVFLFALMVCVVFVVLRRCRNSRFLIIFNVWHLVVAKCRY